jgi:hypothetical protein
MEIETRSFQMQMNLSNKRMQERPMEIETRVQRLQGPEKALHRVSGRTQPSFHGLVPGMVAQDHEMKRNGVQSHHSMVSCLEW